MTIREIAITKLQQLPEPLLQEVSDFIDFVAHQHQLRNANSEIQNNTSSDTSKAWEEWFESVDRLETTSIESTNQYQQLLLNKYQQQGLEL